MDHSNNFLTTTLDRGNDPDNPEQIALLLIEEWIHNEGTYHVAQADLIHALINDQEVPETYSQLLLIMKTIYLIDQKQYDEVIALLEPLTNPAHRLTCNTSEYYELLLLKIDVFFLKHDCQAAYHYVKNLHASMSLEENFILLDDHEQLMTDCNIKMAIAAHLCALNESYDLFKAFLFPTEGAIQLAPKNVQFFIFFAYECFRQSKFTEAVNTFSNLFDFIKKNQAVIEIDYYQEVTAMLILSKSLDGQSVGSEEAMSFKQLFSDLRPVLSDHNQRLKNYVDLCSRDEKHPVLFTPGFNFFNERPALNEMVSSHKKHRVV